MTSTIDPITAEQLADWVGDVHERTILLVDDLTDTQMMGPQMEIVNPLLWEIGHTAWFFEKLALRNILGRQPARLDYDDLFDSIAVVHDVRWDLPLPTRGETFQYMRQIRDSILDALQTDGDNEPLRFHIRYSVYHADMHTEAYTYMRQTLDYPPPKFATEKPTDMTAPITGDVEITGGDFFLGASRDEPFVFDNEKWGQAVNVEPFAIARAAVTQAEFLAFVEDDGYQRQELWSEEGWQWREQESAQQPVYWRRESNGNWSRRDFDHWLALEPNLPMLHVNWFEANAYCRWAGRRLPSEAEWELAAAAEFDSAGCLTERKRRYPWGDEIPTHQNANLNWQAMGTVPVSALVAGDSASGCRQMLGNVWEWTDSTFASFPGFVHDAYKEYSIPWFHSRKVLRGGSWATRSRLIRSGYRNYYTPDRRDVWAGFRTCAVDG